MKNKNKKHRVGIVVSDKMQKTRVVRVEEVKRHPMYQKIMRFNKKYKIHDENNQSSIGDLVEILEARPLSREKRWILNKIIKKQSDTLKVSSEEVKV